MNNNKFFYFDGATVERTNAKNFKVIFEDEEATIFVNSTDVNRVLKKVNEEEEVIAILLAYIEYIYQSTKQTSSERIKRLETEFITENVIVILSRYVAEDLIMIIKQMKWHEIVFVFESKDPIQEIERRF